MDQMLPSPGFSIPSIGTPLHQPDEDQQILPNALQQQQDLQQQSSTLQQNQQQPPPLMPIQSMQPMSSLQNNLMQTPQKSLFGAGLSTIMQPQTPVSYEYNLTFDHKLIYFMIISAKFDVSHDTATTLYGTFYPRSYDPHDSSICRSWNTSPVTVS